jgi:alpha-methylacyl-CoA racemase
MLLADLGADVVRIDRLRGQRPGRGHGRRATTSTHAGRRSVALDLKRAGRARRRAAAGRHGADVLVEGFRPGVTEAPGPGPGACQALQPARLVYGRMTGFGQSGPLARAAGHDLNYIALTGAAATPSARLAARRCRR